MQLFMGFKLKKHPVNIVGVKVWPLGIVFVNASFGRSNSFHFLTLAKMFIFLLLEMFLGGCVGDSKFFILFPVRTSWLI